MKAKTIALLAGAAMAAALAPVQGAIAQESIYSYLPNTALTGVIDPNMPDRTSIDKAWPKTPADPGNIKIGWTQHSITNPWFVATIDGAKRTAEKYGMTLDVQVDADLNTQCSHIDNFITRQMDVIVVDANDPLGIVRCINRAVDAGIPVVGTSGAPGPDARVLTTIMADAYGNAFLMGQYVAKEMGSDTPIVAAALAGHVGNSASDGRVNGMISGIVYERVRQLNLDLTKEDAMLRGFNLFQTLVSSGRAEDPELNFKVVGMGVGGWTLEGGLAAAEDILQAHQQDLNVFLAANDFMGLGAMRAVRGVGKEGQVQIASPADGFRVALDELKKGNMLVNGENSGDKQGVSVIEFINDIFNKGVDPTNLPVASTFPPAIITRDNVDEKIDPDTSNLFFRYELTPVLSIPELRAQAAAEVD